MIGRYNEDVDDDDACLGSFDNTEVARLQVVLTISDVA